MNKLLRSVLAIFTFGALAACGGTGGSDSLPPVPTVGCSTTTAGDLTVTFAGTIPTGKTGAVKVYDASGTLAGTATATSPTLSGLAAGAYVLVSTPLSGAANAIVRQAYDAAVSPDQVCIGDGTTETSTATYALIPTSNKLWVGSQGSGINNTVSYAATSLTATATVAATTVNTTKGHSGFAIDTHGNLWVLGQSTTDPLLARYPAGSFSAGGAKTPDFTVPLSAIPYAAPHSKGLAISPRGHIWVSSPGNDEVYRFKAAPGGVVETTPSVTITGLNYPTGLAFDASGTLWVSDTGSGHLLRYSVFPVTDGAILSTPSVDTNPGQDVTGIAFDAAGNLWVASLVQGQLIRVGSAALYGGGNVTPDKWFAAGSLPVSVAIDENGLVWVGGNAGSIRAFNPGAANGTAAIRTITTNTSEMNYGESLAFYPAPAALPLAHSLP